MKKKVYAGILISLGMGAAAGGLLAAGARTGAAGEGDPIPGSEPVILFDQGLGLGLDASDGSFYPMYLLAAERRTGLYVQAAPETFDGVLDETEYIRVSGDAEKIFYARDYDEETELYDFSDDTWKWEAGEYHVSLYLNGAVAEEDVVFRDMKDIRVLVVPMNTFYGEEWLGVEEVPEDITDFTMQVYPLGENDLEWNVLKQEDGGAMDLEYDINSVTGRYRIWRELSGLDDGENPYDLILGLVPRNIRTSEESLTADIAGFTFGGKTSVISLGDTCPAVTVAHEIGHCCGLGDEYENGMVSPEANRIPFGMRGRDKRSLGDMVTGECPYIISGQDGGTLGTGTLVRREQLPFDVLTGELLERDMSSFMGLSGFPREEYWTTTDIWNRMYEVLTP